MTSDNDFKTLEASLVPTFAAPRYIAAANDKSTENSNLTPSDSSPTISIAYTQIDAGRTRLYPNCNNMTSVRNEASSTGFVGSFWLGQFPERVKQCDLSRFKLPETAGFSHSQFRFVVEALEVDPGSVAEPAGTITS